MLPIAGSAQAGDGICLQMSRPLALPDAGSSYRRILLGIHANDCPDTCTVSSCKHRARTSCLHTLCAPLHQCSNWGSLAGDHPSSAHCVAVPLPLGRHLSGRYRSRLTVIHFECRSNGPKSPRPRDASGTALDLHHPFPQADVPTDIQETWPMTCEGVQSADAACMTLITTSAIERL